LQYFLCTQLVKIYYESILKQVFKLFLQKLILIFVFIFLQTTLFAFSWLEGKSDEKSDTTKRISFVPVPYLNYNRTGGFEFGAIPMAMYKLNKQDTISPPSMSGMVGMYSTEKNWVGMAFQRLYFKEDRWSEVRRELISKEKVYKWNLTTV